MKRFPLLFLLSFFPFVVFANPYPDPSAVPQDPEILERIYPDLPSLSLDSERIDLLRVDVEWSVDETYVVKNTVIEPSGTPALLARAKNRDEHGSYQGSLYSPLGQQALSFSSVGTGAEFRTLTRAMSFRFPLPESVVEFRLEVENPQTGIMEKVLSHWIQPGRVARLLPNRDIETRLIKKADVADALIVAIYAEGYLESKKNVFWQDAQRIVDSLQNNHFPGFANMEFRATFGPSTKTLGNATNLGMPIPERDSFLGLYFPYWASFGRWYHVVYPTREVRYRNGIGQVAYDYPLMVLDDNQYWGVGNFMELTAIPSRNSSFTYLLLHELGHFFGLNEEYESGGKTELAFAPKISEPWSQNITFSTKKTKLKWADLVSGSTPIPTPGSHWTGSGPIGAYKGGYAETPPLGKSHKPGKGCVMSSSGNFCTVCRRAIENRVRFDLGS